MTDQTMEPGKSIEREIALTVVKTIQKQIASVTEKFVVKKRQETAATLGEVSAPEAKDTPKEPFILTHQWLEATYESSIEVRNAAHPKNSDAHQYDDDPGAYFIHYEWNGKRLVLSTSGDKPAQFNIGASLSESSKDRIMASARWCRLFPKYIGMVQETLRQTDNELPLDYIQKWPERIGVNPIEVKALPAVIGLYKQLSGPEANGDAAKAYFSGELIRKAFVGRDKITWQVAAAYCELHGMSTDEATKLFGLDKPKKQFLAEAMGDDYVAGKQLKPKHPETEKVESLIRRYDAAGGVSGWYNVSSTFPGRLMLMSYYAKRSSELQNVPATPEAEKRTVAEIALMMMLHLVPEDEAMQLVKSMSDAHLFAIVDQMVQDYSETPSDEASEDEDTD